MNSRLIERRTELLKERSLGISLNRIVKDLATKYHVSTRAIYYDWKHRMNWMEAILDIEDPATLFFEIIATHKEIKKLAGRLFLTADNDSARVGALRLLRDVNKDFVEMIITKNLILRVGRLEDKRVLSSADEKI